MKITEPGIYLDFDTASYFADPCPEPSLTQSVAKILIDKSPLHAWYAHPKMNPDYRHDDDSKFDTGNVAHAIMLGRGRDVVELQAPDWNATGMGPGAKKELHKQRDELRAAGKLAVLTKTVVKANKMVVAAIEQLRMRGLDRFFRDGHGEVVTAWQEFPDDNRFGAPIWLRQMIDWYDPQRLEVLDYKTSDMSAAPHGIDRMMFNAGWSIQAAMAERGLDALDPDNAGRRKFYFVVQETELPYQLTVVQLTRGPMVMGAKQLDRAVELWRHCMETGIWPGYPLDIVTPEWPAFAEQQWLTREIHHEAIKRVPQFDAENMRAG